jgi:hypothetical protein
MKKMKTTLALALLFLTLLSFGQTIPAKEKATKDFQIKKESIEKQLKFLGIETGLKDVKVEHSEGPYRKYSVGAISYYYDHVADQDAAYHKFKLTTPTYANGDKFVLEVVMDYDSYEYLSSGYRKSLNKYELRSARVSVKSYEGKELTSTQLLEKLNDLSIIKGKEFEVANKYHFVAIDEVKFEKKGQRNYQGTTLYNYEIKIKGTGAEFESNGDNYIEYEIRKTADIEAYYTADIGLSKGQWKFVDYSLKQNRSKEKITNIVEDPDVPAYISLRYKSLKEIMAGPHFADDISVYSIKYMNDLKSLVLFRLNTVPKEEFIKGELLTNLFASEEGKSAIEQYYNLRQTMKDYYLDSVSVGFASNRTQILEGKTGQFDISYSVKRDASKELNKKAKADGASKTQLAIIKYPGQGYYSLSMQLKVVDGKVVFSEVREPGSVNRIKYINGGEKTHPISIVD